MCSTRVYSTRIQVFHNFLYKNSKNESTNDFEKNGTISIFFKIVSRLIFAIMELFSPEKFQPYLSVIS